MTGRFSAMTEPIIQMVDPLLLWAALDTSVDLGIDGDTMEEVFENKLDESFECGLSDHIVDHGFVNPICVQVTDMGRWVQGNGNHRLAVAIAAMLDEIPVAFSNDDDYMWDRITQPSSHHWCSEWAKITPQMIAKSA